MAHYVQHCHYTGPSSDRVSQEIPSFTFDGAKKSMLESFEKALSNNKKEFVSEILKMDKVSFPSFTNEKIYMIPFYQKYGLPQKLKRWSATVKQMLGEIKYDGPMYLMVDQGEVKKGETHRRKGAHIDGNWIPSHLERIYGEEMAKEVILFASNIVGCAAYLGIFPRVFGEGGDCSHLDLSKTKKIILKPNVCYMGDELTIHESIPVKKDCKRTMVRINIPRLDINNYKKI